MPLSPPAFMSCQLQDDRGAAWSSAPAPSANVGDTSTGRRTRQLPSAAPAIAAAFDDEESAPARPRSGPTPPARGLDTWLDGSRIHLA